MPISFFHLSYYRSALSLRYDLTNSTFRRKMIVRDIRHSVSKTNKQMKNRSWPDIQMFFEGYWSANEELNEKSVADFTVHFTPLRSARLQCPSFEQFTCGNKKGKTNLRDFIIILFLNARSYIKNISYKKYVLSHSHPAETDTPLCHVSRMLREGRLARFT